jgi:DNA invertase Pin-like site-specific DNA recombinase
MRRRREPNPSLGIGYIRASADESSLTALAQREAIEAHCEQSSVELVATFEDVGANFDTEVEKRSGFLEALAQLSSVDAGVFVVAKRECLASDPMQAAMAQRLVERQGVVLVSAGGVASDPESEALRSYIDAFEAYEVVASECDLIVRRNDRKRRQNVVAGSDPR